MIAVPHGGIVPRSYKLVNFVLLNEYLSKTAWFFRFLDYSTVMLPLSLFKGALCLKGSSRSMLSGVCVWGGGGGGGGTVYRQYIM